ncbi:MAG: formylglycine-generating enzyme family protein [Oceanidesulfovibrio sp.]
MICIALCVCPDICRGADAANGQPGATWTEPATGMEFILVPGGCFDMGRAPGVEEMLLREVHRSYFENHYADEVPTREMCVDSFWIARREITQGEWETVTGEANKTCHKVGRGKDLPANFITYEDVLDFAEGLASLSSQHGGDGSVFRTPTEAEWEYACKAGRNQPFSTGMKLTPEDARYGVHRGADGELERTETVAPVGSYPANAYGVYDLHGNVEEWTSTLYTPEPGVEPIFEERGSPRVVKGGSYFEAPRNLRCSHRKRATSLYVSCRLGARLVRVPPASEQTD